MATTLFSACQSELYDPGSDQDLLKFLSGNSCSYLVNMTQFCLKKQIFPTLLTLIYLSVCAYIVCFENKVDDTAEYAS